MSAGKKKEECQKPKQRHGKPHYLREYYLPESSIIILFTLAGATNDYIHTRHPARPTLDEQRANRLRGSRLSERICPAHSSR
jgi:hypothetical protein